MMREKEGNTEMKTKKKKKAISNKYLVCKKKKNITNKEKYARSIDRSISKRL